jgi:chromosome segregation ATPase
VEQAITAHRSIIVTDEFKELERLRELARHNEASAIGNARREADRIATEREGRKWQAVVEDKEAVIAGLAADRDADKVAIAKLAADRDADKQAIASLVADKDADKAAIAKLEASIADLHSRIGSISKDSEQTSDTTI